MGKKNTNRSKGVEGNTAYRRKKTIEKKMNAGGKKYRSDAEGGMEIVIPENNSGSL